MGLLAFEAGLFEAPGCRLHKLIAFGTIINIDPEVTKGRILPAGRYFNEQRNRPLVCFCRLVAMNYSG